MKKSSFIHIVGKKNRGTFMELLFPDYKGNFSIFDDVIIYAHELEKLKVDYKLVVFEYDQNLESKVVKIGLPAERLLNMFDWQQDIYRDIPYLNDFTRMSFKDDLQKYYGIENKAFLTGSMQGGEVVFKNKIESTIKAPERVNITDNNNKKEFYFDSRGFISKIELEDSTLYYSPLGEKQIEFNKQNGRFIFQKNEFTKLEFMEVFISWVTAQSFVENIFISRSHAYYELLTTYFSKQEDALDFEADEIALTKLDVIKNNSGTLGKNNLLIYWEREISLESIEELIKMFERANVLEIKMRFIFWGPRADMLVYSRPLQELAKAYKLDWSLFTDGQIFDNVIDQVSQTRIMLFPVKKMAGIELLAQSIRTPYLDSEEAIEKIEVIAKDLLSDLNAWNEESISLDQVIGEHVDGV